MFSLSFPLYELPGKTADCLFLIWGPDQHVIALVSVQYFLITNFWCSRRDIFYLGKYLPLMAVMCKCTHTRCNNNTNNDHFFLIRLKYMLCTHTKTIYFFMQIGWRTTNAWLAGNFACKIFLVLRAFGLYLSSNVLVCISLDR